MCIPQEEGRGDGYKRILGAQLKFLKGKGQMLESSESRKGA